MTNLAPILGSIAIGIAITAACAVVFRSSLYRPNFQGRSIPTAFGLSFAIAVSIWAPVTTFTLLGSPTVVELWYYMIAINGFALLGYLDDIYGDRSIGGLKGHLSALFARKVTTGAIKALGGVALGLWLGCMVYGVSLRGVTAAVLIAGTANALNLLDLRPGRCLAGFFVGLIPLTALLMAGQSTVPVEVEFSAICAVCLLVGERRARYMLGDTGANAFGAALGLSYALYLPINAQLFFAFVVVAFHIWTEKHSISQFIEAHPTLRAVDRLIGVR